MAGGLAATVISLFEYFTPGSGNRKSAKARKSRLGAACKVPRGRAQQRLRYAQKTKKHCRVGTYRVGVSRVRTGRRRGAGGCCGRPRTPQGDPLQVPHTG